MTALRRLLLRFVAVFRHARAEAELAREVDAHLAILTEEYQRRGLSLADATVEARRTFGSVAHAKDLQRDSRSFIWLDETWRDVRFALRMLRRSPGFTAVAVLTLGIGIGVNTTVFTVTRAVLFNGFPLVQDNDRLTRWTTASSRTSPPSPLAQASCSVSCRRFGCPGWM